MGFITKKRFENVNNIHDEVKINEINYHDISYLKQRIYLEKSKAERKQKTFSIILININRIMEIKNLAFDLSQLVKKIISQICINIREADLVAVDDSNRRINILLPDTSGNQVKQVISRLINKLSSNNELKEYAGNFVNNSNVGILTYPIASNGNGRAKNISKIEGYVNSISRGSYISNFLNSYRLKLGSMFSGLALNGNSLIVSHDRHYELNVIDELSKKLQFVIKRGIDILGAGFGLIVASPVMLLTIFLIKVTSRGPVFFRQTRIGYRGKKFRMFKFRSMRQDASEATHKDYILKLVTDDIDTNEKDDKVTGYKSQIDSRITGIGSFIRKTSIDELPQLINVLAGDMSLVGPRPHPIYEVELYKSWYYRRLLVKPGLAGLSKLYVRCTPKNYEKAMHYDVRYVDCWSLMHDLKIVFKTIPSLFSKNGAY